MQISSYTYILSEENITKDTKWSLPAFQYRAVQFEGNTMDYEYNWEILSVRNFLFVKKMWKGKSFPTSYSTGVPSPSNGRPPNMLRRHGDRAVTGDR